VDLSKPDRKAILKGFRQVKVCLHEQWKTFKSTMTTAITCQCVNGSMFYLCSYLHVQLIELSINCDYTVNMKTVLITADSILISYF
jgi:hypothetical protein